MSATMSSGGSDAISGVTILLTDVYPAVTGRKIAERDYAKAIRRVLAARPKPQAFVCRGDTTALELVKTLGRLGCRVPKGVKVVGFDDIPAAATANPPLTTIRQPSSAIAAAAFRTLVGRIAAPTLPPCEIYLPAPLVV